MGNRLTETVGASQPIAYSYNNLDQLTLVNHPGATPDVSYTYSARGNLATQTVTGSASLTYTFDARDRLTAVTQSGGVNASYVYDVDGRRVRQTANGVITKYVWDERSMYGDVVAELNASNAVNVSYVLGPNGLISQKRGATTNYYLADAQGSTRALTTPAAAITDTYRYSAFGDIETQTGSTVNSYLYTGQQFDASTGLYSLRARYYDAAVGRFLSRDTFPINHQNPMELNRYVYAAGNPIRYSDPSGMLIDFGELISSAKNSIQATVGTFYRSFAQSWMQGFTAGVLGWLTGKLILAWLLPEGNQIVGDYNWTTHLSNGVDLLAAGLLGIGFNSPLTSQLTANLGVSIFVSRVQNGGIADMLAAMQAARAQIVTSMTVLMSTIIPFKDWGIALAQGESMADAAVETVLDLFKAVIYGGGAYTSSMIISHLEIHSFGNAIDRFLSRNGLRAYLLTTMGVVFDGLVNLGSDTFDNLVNAPTN